MRKFLGFAVFFLLLLIAKESYAAPAVMLNHNYIQFDTSPIIEDGRVLVPLRAIFESLGASVEWDEAAQKIISKKGDIQIILTIGRNKAVKNGVEVILDVPPKVVENRTLVPLRFISEAFGAEVKWDEASQRVTIDSRVTKLTTEEVSKHGNTVVSVICGEGDEMLQGSGVILSSVGHIITNAHVLDEYETGEVVLWDGRKYKFEVLEVDYNYDLALIKINALGLPFAVIGDSDKLSIGQDVIAIGNPLDLQNTVSSGILSGKRSEKGYNLLQVSTPISFGSSGGALFDSYGKLVGITTMGFLIGDLNFAIPVDDVARWIVANNFGEDIGVPLEILQEGKGSYFKLSAAAIVKFTDAHDLHLDTEFKSRISKSNGEIFFCVVFNYKQPNKLVFYELTVTHFLKQDDGYEEIYSETFYSLCKPHWEGAYLFKEVLVVRDINGCAVPGSYKTICHVDGVKIAEGEFEVY